MAMDAASLAALCKQHRLYQTPALNDRLYANFRGFTAIGALEAYTGLRALFLEGNALDSVAGLPPLPELRCLFLQQNALLALEPGVLAALPQLDTLNVGGNALTSLAGLAGCTQLRTLVAADNSLAFTDALAALATCTQLESVDLQNNKLEDGQALLGLLKGLPHLKCLYLRGNPLVSKLPSYRKTTIAALPGLTYLDDRPITELERACAEAWAAGGLDGEREARAAFHQREQEREARQVAALREIREAGWRKRREALGLDPEGGDPDLEGLTDDAELEEAEPAELRSARDRLAAFTAARQAVAADAEEAPPGLMDADVEAVLEESRASRAALLAEAAAQQAQQAAAPPQSSCLGSGTCEAEAAVAPPPVLPAVPTARQTVVLGPSCGDAGAEAAPAGEQEQESEASVHTACPTAAGVQAVEAGTAPQLMDSGEAIGSECSVPSRASSSDDEPDILEELD
ncbi:dynein assembly factor axonemal [Chlorella sorokiniana]|uniref:Dynein assembly factor axonemal n=1 Tax=Chlorella sorokiniana TaxID=3076 RepID=A0A2P6TZG7_CHLSO|nr:dynein assembly factor axonemal [Chlorella sorokiniana]|eukprot:PRW59455.1 dynein assembly factor axonemal [Chlorella sorokiniana]